MNKYKHNSNNPFFLYFRFRESAYYPFFFYGLIILICIALIYFVIIPLVQNLFNVNKEVNETRARVGTLQNNLQFLSTVNSQTLDQQVLLADQAYPQLRDFSGAIQAVNISAVVANIKVDDFAFNVGDESKIDGKAPKLPVNSKLDDHLTLNISVHGDSSSIKKFMTEVKTRLPLATLLVYDEVQTVENIRITFASDLYTVKNIDLAHTKIALTAKTAATLDKLSQWQAAMNSIEAQIPSTASVAASQSPF